MVKSLAQGHFRHMKWAGRRTGSALLLADGLSSHDEAVAREAQREAVYIAAKTHFFWIDRR